MVSIPVIGNGDINSPAAAVEMVEETGCAGVMLGRGLTKDPWLARDVSRALTGLPPLPPPTLGRAMAGVPGSAGAHRGTPRRPKGGHPVPEVDSAVGITPQGRQGRPLAVAEDPGPPDPQIGAGGVGAQLKGCDLSPTLVEQRRSFRYRSSPRPPASTRLGGRMQEGEVVLRTEGLSRSVGQAHIVSGVSVEVRIGDVLAVVGPSGSGKSSFLRLLNRLDEPTSGTVFLHERDYQLIPPRELRRRVGMVLQAPFLFPGQSRTTSGSVRGNGAPSLPMRPWICS